MGGIETAKALMETGKKALDIANELKNVELKESILELREQLLLLKEENVILKEELSKKQKYNMVYENNAYWNVKDDGTKDGPYCSACWDNSQKAIHMPVDPNYHKYYNCPICKNEIYIE